MNKDEFARLYERDFNGGYRLSEALLGKIMREGVTVSDSSLSALAGSDLKPFAYASEPGYESGFIFGRKSLAEQKGVHPNLIAVANLALKYSTQDFCFFDGLRLPKEQQTLVARGASKTLKSKHLKQASGFAEAMDLVPVVGTLPTWDWELIYPVVCAVDRAATELGFADSIVWGGAWDRRLSDFGGYPQAYLAEVEKYRQRTGKGFIDGPHYEWRG